jgi:uncharacterized protein YkwD
LELHSSLGVLVLGMGDLHAFRSPRRCCTLAATLTLSLNAYRRAHHRPPLAYSSAPAAAAKGHANDLAQRNRLGPQGLP